MFLIEDNRLVTVEDNPLLGNPFDRGRQRLALDVTALIDQFLWTQTVIHTHDSLLNNRPLVQIRRDEMCRGADNLNTAIVRLMVRLRALERRQETVVDIDDFSRHGGAQSRRQDLHVARQHDEIDVILLDQVQDLRFLLVLGVGFDGQMVERDVVASGQVLEIRMVGYDARNLDGELLGRLTEEEVVETVSDFGHHD